MLILTRPIDHEMDYEGHHWRFKRCSASLGAAREGLIKRVAKLAHSPEECSGMTVEDFGACLTDLAGHITEIDKKPSKEILGDAPRQYLDEHLSASEVVGLWVRWYQSSQIDDEARGKSPE